MTRVILTHNGYTAEIYTHGAHVTSWKTPSGEEQLFVSNLALFTPPKAIRGGIPLCWPQFSDLGPCTTQHGFARNSEFEITASTPDSVTMALRGGDQDQEDAQFPDFPHLFTLLFTVSIGEGWLHQELTVQNSAASPAPFQFTTALHTYFRLQRGSIETAAVRGLQNCHYLDSLEGRVDKVETAEEVRFAGEVDRIYMGVPDTGIVIVDGSGGDGSKEEAQRRVKIEKTNLSDAVVWNPYMHKAQKMADFGDDEWREMVCVEVAQAGSGAVEVAPGGQWRCSQKLSLL